MTIFTARLISIALNSSTELNRAIDPKRSKVCRACGLYLNQLPATDRKRKVDVFWVGLSAVAFSDDEEKLPLSPLTRSGSLVADIEKPYKTSMAFYKTNLVKCLPLKQDKIRYPLQHEMEKCFPNLINEIETLKPRIVFLLGKQVASFVLSKIGIERFSLHENFKCTSFQMGKVIFVPIHHPSFILVYKRKFLNDYIVEIQSLMSSHIEIRIKKKTKSSQVS
jgi:uracil-DNA glycosylase